MQGDTATMRLSGLSKNLERHSPGFAGNIFCFYSDDSETTIYDDEN